MSKLLDWAESYVRRYEELLNNPATQNGGASFDSLGRELYDIAQAIIEDNAPTPAQEVGNE